MNPPLRAEDDRQALIEAVRSGLIDCIATDHAPHSTEEKEVPFEEAAMGVTGLETAFAALHTELVLPGVLDLGILVERMSAGAAPFGLRASEPGARDRRHTRSSSTPTPSGRRAPTAGRAGRTTPASPGTGWWDAS